MHCTTYLLLPLLRPPTAPLPSCRIISVLSRSSSSSSA
jgi:hypothetical protein